MKFIVLIAALLAVATATMFEEEENLYTKAQCKKWAPMARKWMKTADANHNKVLHKWEAWKLLKKTQHDPKWNAWLKAHKAKLSKAGLKAYWKKRAAYMKVHREKFLANWRKFYGRDYVSYKTFMGKWWKACLAGKKPF